MKILLDTNVIIDIISSREPFFKQSRGAFAKILNNSYVPCIGASAVTDIVYILRKYIPDQTSRYQKVQNLLKLVEVEDTKKSTIEQAFDTGITDYEDAVQFQTCVENDIDLIITRNTHDFANSKIPAISPEEFIK
ncbi:MAG: PIN domain-containing protein [Treponema sp.]|nr:PIN domain-containing protein [Treponema sp.]